MKQWMERIKQGLRHWMAGRYGQDKLSVMLSRAGLVLILICIFIPHNILTALALVCCLLSLLRSFSKNKESREKELAAYQQLVDKAAGWFGLQKHRWEDRKTHRYYKCSCGKVLRVPKGKGKIEITCPQCHGHMIHKT